MSRLKVERLNASSSHVNRIARWLNEEWGLERGFSLAATLEWCLEASDAPREALFGALVEDALVGAVLLVENDLETEPDMTPWLSGLYVAREHRRHTIGARLVDAVEDAARAQGHPWLYLYCRAGPLEGYYADLGWRSVKAIQVDGKPCVIMAKRL
jgi:GNAT superfamily N-acetyltransferase